MQLSILQERSMNASQLLGYATTNEMVDCLCSKYSKKWEHTGHTCVTLQAFHSLFSGENIIQSYSKSLVSNKDSKIWWCYSSHWLSENIHQDILKCALKNVLERSKKSLHLAQCLPYTLPAWGATSHSLNFPLLEFLCQGKSLTEKKKTLLTVIARSYCKAIH